MTSSVAKRFTIFGAVRLTALAITRRPAALLLVVLANVITTAGLAAIEGAWLRGPGLLPFKLAYKLAFVLNDATLATLALVIAVEGLRQERLSWLDRWRITLGLFAPALLLALIDALPRAVLEVMANLWARGIVANHFGWFILADLIIAIDRRLSPLGAVREAMALSAGRRWQLLWIATGFGLIQLALVLGVSLPFLLAGQSDHWASDGGAYLAGMLGAVVAAALYLELAGLTDRQPERTAETFA